MNSVFLDTNFFLDIFDSSRGRHPKAKVALEYFLERDIGLYTSSDIIATISYFLQKHLTIQQCVINIEYIVQKVKVLSAINSDFIALNRQILEQYSLNDRLKIDYEDCMQLFLAHKYNVEAIVTSDKNFCSGIKEHFQVNVMSLDDLAI